MPHPPLDIDKVQYRAVLLLANAVVLLLMALVLMLLKDTGYHPIDAGDPFLSLPLWQRVGWLAGTLGAVEAAILWDGKRA